MSTTNETTSAAIHTHEESMVLMHLADAWRAFLALKIQHPDEQSDFRKAIHDAQGIMAVRLARRVDPMTWPTHEA